MGATVSVRVANRSDLVTMFYDSLKIIREDFPEKFDSAFDETAVDDFFEGIWPQKVEANLVGDVLSVKKKL